MFKYIFILMFSLGALFTTKAQYKDEVFYKGKMRLADKTRLKIGSVQFGDSLVKAIDLKTGEKFSVPYYEIQYVKILGNNRMFWEGVGIGLIAATALTTVVVISEGNPLDMQNYVSGFVRTGPLLAVVGGMVGFTIKRYDPVPLGDIEYPKTDLGLSGYGIGLTLRF